MEGEGSAEVLQHILEKKTSEWRRLPIKGISRERTEQRGALCSHCKSSSASSSVLCRRRIRSFDESRMMCLWPAVNCVLFDDSPSSFFFARGDRRATPVVRLQSAAPSLF